MVQKKKGENYLSRIPEYLRGIQNISETSLALEKDHSSILSKVYRSDAVKLIYLVLEVCRSSLLSAFKFLSDIWIKVTIRERAVK